MSEEQKRFDDLMKKVIKVSPEELKRRMAEAASAKKPLAKPCEDAKHGNT